MRKAILFLAAAVLLLSFVALPASATPPLHERYEISGVFDPGNPDPDLSFGVPEICDFDYVQTWSGIANVTTWGDPLDFDRQIWTGPIEVTHTNATAAVTLLEKASYTVILEDNGAVETDAGLVWHLRDSATGRVVLVMAGRMVLDSSADTVTFTPNLDPDFWAVLCPALGGEVA
jgi:hypothetical protein